MWKVAGFRSSHGATQVVVPYDRRLPVHPAVVTRSGYSVSLKTPDLEARKSVGVSSALRRLAQIAAPLSQRTRDEENSDAEQYIHFSTGLILIST